MNTSREVPPTAEHVPMPLVRLAEARAEVAEQQLVDARLAAASAAFRDAYDRLERVEQALDREAADVDRLEHAGPARWWADLRGTRETDLDRERAELRTAAEGVERAADEAEGLHAELQALTRRSDALAGADARLEVALEVVARGVDGLDASHPHEVSAAASELSRRREQREIHEALVAGAAALTTLRSAHSVLASADAWSGWDTFGGGGVLSSMVKHDRLDQARDRLAAASAALEGFTRELDDLHLPGVTLARFDGLTRGVDIWFDNVFTDLSVRSEIKRTRADVENALARVEEAVAALHARQGQLDG